jgi:hypothetical protein
MATRIFFGFGREKHQDQIGQTNFRNQLAISAVILNLGTLKKLFRLMKIVI